MAERVVDVLEAIEIDQEEAAIIRLAVLAAHHLIERLAHHDAVGQAGEGVMAGKAADLGIEAVAIGKVRAHAAKADEALEIVKRRTAGQRPPAFSPLRLGAHLQIGEGQPGRKMEAERALAAAEFDFTAAIGDDQIGQRRAEQRVGFAGE